jgi:hypothetical protein
LCFFSLLTVDFGCRLLQVRSSATGTSISTLNRRASELTNTMDSLQRQKHDLARSEQAFLEDRIRRVVETTESIAADRDDEKIMGKLKDLAKVLEDEHGGVSSPTKTALQLQEETSLANPAYLAWSLTQYIRNSILVSLPLPPKLVVVNLEPHTGCVGRGVCCKWSIESWLPKCVVPKP